MKRRDTVSGNLAKQDRNWKDARVIPSVKTAIAVTALAGAGAFLATPAQAIVVANPSFETPAVPTESFIPNPTGADWTFSGYTGVSDIGGPFFAGTPPNGSQAAYLQGNLGAYGNTISQSLTGFTLGDSYSVTFWITDRPGYPADPVTVLLGGTSLGTYTPTSTDFVQETTASLVATTGTMTLTFAGGDNDPADWDSAIDAVSINETAPIPEPGSLLVVGAGLLVLAVRRRRQPS